MISLRVLVERMERVEGKERSRVLAEIFENNLLNSSVATSCRRVADLLADPSALFNEVKRRELVFLYDLILRDIARNAGLVVYRGKVGNQMMERCNLDFPIFPWRDLTVR
jgi:hypothetical protein